MIHYHVWCITYNDSCMTYDVWRMMCVGQRDTAAYACTMFTTQQCRVLTCSWNWPRKRICEQTESCAPDLMIRQLMSINQDDESFACSRPRHWILQLSAPCYALCSYISICTWLDEKATDESDSRWEELCIQSSKTLNLVSSSGMVLFKSIQNCTNIERIAKHFAKRNITNCNRV